MIVALEPGHWSRVREIYAAGIHGGDATFETAPPSWEQWDAGHLRDHRFVALDRDDVLGWAAVSPASQRAVYRGVVEESVYVEPAAHGRGLGRALLQALIDSTERAGIWTLQAGIFPENLASIALHERMGFRRVGVHERLGQHADGRWRDVVRMERRSSVAGC